MFLKWKPVCIVLTVLLLSGCGLGTAGLVAAGNGGGGGSTPTITSFDVLNPKVSPATLRLEASQPVLVELFYARPGVATTAMMELSGPGVSGNQVQLPSGATDLVWNFENELGGPEFVADVDLFARHPNGASISGGTLHLGMGNDPPVMLLVDPMPTDPANPDESSGNVEVRLGVRDSSSDVVAIEMEWRRASDAPDAWQLATAAGVFPTGIETNRIGVEFSFFWNTNVDLADGDDDVFLRAIADDGTLDPNNNPIGISAPLESGLLHIDNNEEPILQLFTEVLITSPDTRRGLPVPFRVLDEESDLVEVLFQWRGENEAFPDLPEDRSELEAILADPTLRRERHVCSEYRHHAEGRVAAIGGTSIRLHELAAREAWILASGLEGRTLELLRASSIPEALTPTWASNPIDGPVSALPFGDGLTALILDAPGAGNRLREIELATGTVVREIAMLGPGIPTAAALERGSAAVLVASDLAGSWRLDRVELATGSVTEIYTSGPADEPPPVRGLASLGTEALVLTAGSSLLHLDHRDPLAPRLGVIRSELATPWGVAVDSLVPDLLYVAERDANRVLAIELASHGKNPVVVRTEELLPGILESPELLALENHGARLLVSTAAAVGGGRQLVGLELGAVGENVFFAIGPPIAGPLAGVASGPEGQRMLAAPDQDELLVGGGLMQRRRIVAYEADEQRITVEPALLPAPAARWRIQAEPRVRATPEGRSTTFLWDSARDIPWGGPAYLRAFARDDEVGLFVEGLAPKHVQAPLDGDHLRIEHPGFDSNYSDLTSADLDQDGDQDLVSSTATGLMVFWQSAAGVYDPIPLVVAVPGLGFDEPVGVAVADLDQDCDLDIVTANLNSANLTVFWQLTPGTFDSTPLSIDAGNPGVNGGPWSVVAADLDGDDDQDLACATADSSVALVFFQTSPGSFDSSLDLAAGTSVGPPIAAADLDGDRDLDIVTANDAFSTEGYLAVYIQTAPEVFDPPFVLKGPSATFVPGDVAAADIDGDGDQDLIAANRGYAGSGSYITVFFQESPGTFDSIQEFALPAETEPFWLSVADLDSDSRLDVVAGTFFPVGGSARLVGLFQDSGGSFDPHVLTTSTVIAQPITGDLDGDGDVDLAFHEFDGQTSSVSCLFQASPGSFRMAAEPLRYPTLIYPTSVATSDLDGDGDLDLVANSSVDYSNGLHIFFQHERGGFDPVPKVLAGSSRGSVAAADLDGDGDQDLAAGGSTLEVFFQDPPGTFGLPLVLDSPTNSVAAVDLDGDGDTDLVSAYGGSFPDFDGRLTVFLQGSRPGSFELPSVIAGSEGIPHGYVMAADLDADLDQDLVSAHGNLTVFLQTPTGFDLHSLVADGAAFATAGDMDGDGDLDLVCSNYGYSSGTYHGSLGIYFQTSPGSFDPTPFVIGGIPAGSGAFSVAAADLDGDGDQDLASANRGDFDSGTLSVFLQGSPGKFAPPLLLGGFPITDDATHIVAADLDGDGDQDLISANLQVFGGGGNLTIFWGGR